MARLPTVYDFSSLRLHPDGSLVHQITAKNLKPRYAAGTVQDSRGNWFARDAAGSGTVGKYRKVRKEEEQGEEEEPLDPNADDAEYEPSGSKDKGNAKETTGRRQNPRPAKRQKFIQDFDFLAPGPSSWNGESSTCSDQLLPSSDLLKSIHYFASTYYHERGQLFNATKEYRQMRRQNKLMRLERQKKAEEDGDASGESDDDPEHTKPIQRGGRKKGVIGKTIHKKDMYKILDGSALMAIGMLMQEYVTRTLEVRIPDGWEEMMREAYPEGTEDDDNIDDDEHLDGEGTDANSEEDGQRSNRDEGDGEEESENKESDDDNDGDNEPENGRQQDSDEDENEDSGD